MKKMTKKEKLALYKAEKAEKKQLLQKHSLLADWLCQNVEVVVTNMPESFRHDCILSTYNTEALHINVRTLHGDDKLFVSAPGRLTFPIGGFFQYAKESNPALFRVVPKVLRDLYFEGLIDFGFLREVGNSAYFTLKRL